MTTVYQYTDAYLRPLISPEIEDRAAKEVDEEITVAEPWRGRLVVFRAYVLACVESQKSADDLFGVKLKTYRGEYTRAFAFARSAAEAAGGTPLPGRFVAIERG